MLRRVFLNRSLSNDARVNGNADDSVRRGEAGDGYVTDQGRKGNLLKVACLHSCRSYCSYLDLFI